MNELFLSTEVADLAHQLGNHPARLALWGEGCVAARADEETMVITAAGARLATVAPDALLEVSLPKAGELLADEETTDDDLPSVLVDDEPTAAAPADTLLFAELFQFEGIRLIAHTQPLVINQITCSPRARQFADRRNLPDEVIACGQSSVLVPFAPPGVALARETRRRIGLWQDRYKETPKIILFQNHGMVTLGRNVQEVMMITEMVMKYAEIFIGAAMMGGPEFMKPTYVTKLAARGAI
ncbi:MAG TPA: class II aldolase/adducin family protein [Chthoniobacteraceae bacterium]|nr:class II aldolase/adducin family protein [Chthoniobacteraceae bacterium]